jgi:DinB superfamily
MAQSHQNRIHASVSAFQSASEQLIAALERLNDELATRPPGDGGWNAAQIGYHVATTNEFLSGLLSGAVPGAVPVPDGFAENPAIFNNVPAKIETYPQLQPPAGVTRADAIERLRVTMGTTVQAIESLTADRAGAFTVPFPMGHLSMYQVADFIGGHVIRHQKQLQRATA